LRHPPEPTTNSPAVGSAAKISTSLFRSLSEIPSDLACERKAEVKATVFSGFIGLLYTALP
jgi:hypothetical protein